MLSDDWQREWHGLCAGSLWKIKILLFRILTAAVNGTKISKWMTTLTWNKNENKLNVNIINILKLLHNLHNDPIYHLLWATNKYTGQSILTRIWNISRIYLIASDRFWISWKINIIKSTCHSYSMHFPYLHRSGNRNLRVDSNFVPSGVARVSKMILKYIELPFECLFGDAMPNWKDTT